jgi:heat shock protein beta
VLYLTEPIDEPAVNNLGEFKEFSFMDVTREGLDLGDIADEEKKKVCALALALQPFAPSCWPGPEQW